jgi:hypothetical protein
MASNRRKRVNAWMRISGRAFRREDDMGRWRLKAKLFNAYQRTSQYVRDLAMFGRTKPQEYRCPRSTS